ncbi:uncharacterized protein LOC107503401 isoform X3 [Rousettus aegyptiacus]|uniref:uncharacterized protein LOC107503401 isoform X3 n=1 Tax=Rousettus aegyptiacus TaxID=9407 RepID=UPI00168D70A0|nr:uncharacterized protein LOC107503401 isoform X3 [Rousettus aegyptiacus]
MRGRQAGSWAVFHSQNQDPPRSASWLASQAPSPVASPLRWRLTLLRVRGTGGSLELAMEDTILRGLTGVCPREPGGQGPGGAAGSLLHGPISHRGPHHPGGHGPEEEGREGSKTEPMPSRAPAAKASRMSPPGLRREVCREPRAASLASPCLLSFPTWSSSVPEPSAPGRPPKGTRQAPSSPSFSECLGVKPGCETCSGERGTGPYEVGR